METEIKEFMEFIDKNPTAFHACESVRNMLLEKNFEELLESKKWNLEPGKDYFACRNGSSIIAFRLGNNLSDFSFNVAAAHTDSPCFKIKENAEFLAEKHYTRLNTEGYGGMICSTWMDRPLSVAGRLLVKENDSIVSRLFSLEKDLLMIPSVAIHLNRDANDKASYNKQVDMIPLFAGKSDKSEKDGKDALKRLIAKETGIDFDKILGSDLFLYNRQKATVWGLNEEFISSGRLDDQQCLFAILKGFLKSKNEESVSVAAFFDNEEVGSGTKQGAASTFLYDVMKRISIALGKSEEEFLRSVAASFMFSCDNAHCVHPNHPELTDSNNCNYMNEGIVIKSHAGQKYTSDGMSIAVARELASRIKIPLQYFANRSDKNGGSTLGNIAMAQVSMNCVDIGLPQLAMHSSYETSGVKDTLDLIKLMEEFFKCRFMQNGSGTIAISR